MALYRGVEGFDDGGIERNQVKANRQPVNTSSELHNHANAYFKKHYGMPFRNGIFVTKSIDTAEQYGVAVNMLPIGNFKFLWSPKVWDFFEETEELNYEFHDDEVKDPAAHQQNTLAKLDAILSTYITSNLEAAIQSGNEIMIMCDEYYLSSLEEPDDYDEYDEYD